MIQKLQKILEDSVQSGEELGCQLAVYKDGKLMCSLAAGYTGLERKHRVNTDTLFPVFSVGKGVVTTLLHICREKGWIDYEDPVAKYWPEYAQADKEETLVWHILSHRTGLFNIPADIHGTETFNWEKMIRSLQDAAPEDKIGGVHHYHAMTYGVLAGHLAELCSGRSFRELLQEEILAPLGIDHLFFGVPENMRGNIAQITDSGNSDFLLMHNTPEAIGGLNPSSNCCCNAESLAKIYASLTGNGVDGVRLLKPETIENATILRRCPEDTVLPEQWDKFGLGYALVAPQPEIGRIFGHGGACGSEGFADKETGYAVGFTKNQESPTHPLHLVRNRISEVLGLPPRIW